MPEMILTRIQKCRYCRREMSSTPLEYQQNPFCALCLDERIRAATPGGGVGWRREGDYLIAEISQKHPSGARRRRLG